MNDNSRKRYLSYSMFFDTRVHSLTMEIQDNWDESVKTMHRANKERLRTSLVCEFGAIEMERNMENFAALGPVPFSHVSYHNAFFLQARDAFIVGSDYPALCGVCALGERMLNHMIDDLKGDFAKHPLFKKVKQRNSFDNWNFMISTLEGWNVLLSDVGQKFHELKDLRHNSIHFNTSTYHTLREDELLAFRIMSFIIERQFGVFGQQPWLIGGTAGFTFIKREFENNPFVRHFILPNCPLVGERFSIKFNGHGQPVFFDFTDYEAVDVNDDEFAELFRNRDMSKLAEAIPALVVKPGLHPN